MSNKPKKNGIILKGKMDGPLIVMITILLICGLIILVSASGPISFEEEGNNYSYVVSQLKNISIGVGMMLIISLFDYRIIGRVKVFKWIIYIGTITVLVYTGIAGVAAKGARRWLSLGSLSFQPSEFSKIFIILFYAFLLQDIKEKGKINSFKSGFMYPCLFIIPIFVSIFILQNHLSATLLICFIIVVQMFIAGVGIKNFLGGAGLAGIAGFTYLFFSKKQSEGFRGSRIDTWKNLEGADITGNGWQINQSLYAIASGNAFGVGPGQSIQKYSYLPEAQNDFIFAIFAEEYGFLGCILIILLFILFVWRGLIIAKRSNDLAGTLIAAGITILIGVEAAWNIAVVTNTLPVTGILLPFFSYGGTGMIANLMGVGFLLSVSKNRKEKGEEKA